MAKHFLQFGHHAVALHPGTTTIGRSRSCALRLEDPCVSRHHATVFYDSAGIRIRDEQSENGVYVNGRRVRGTVVVTPDDRVAIGTEEFVLVLRNEPSERPTKKYMTPEKADELGDRAKGLDYLSQRERQVFDMLAHGLANREIGERLGLSTKTVETYRARIADKLGVRTRAELVELALRSGILTGHAR